MDMSLIKVTSEELHTQSTQVSSGATTVEDVVTQLSGQISDLASRWEGAASASFQDMYQQWQQGARQCNDAMKSIAAFLSSAATTYEEAEEQIRQAAAR
jgi:WXG100 family type VII secretion target